MTEDKHKHRANTTHLNMVDVNEELKYFFGGGGGGSGGGGGGGGEGSGWRGSGWM